MHDAILADVVYPVEIVGKRVRTKEDGSKTLKCVLDEKERGEIWHRVHERFYLLTIGAGGVDYRLDTYSEVYRKLTGRSVGFEFPMSGATEY